MGSERDFSRAPSTDDVATDTEDRHVEPGGLDLHGADIDDADAPDWWHRDHPTFAALVGFYAGVVTILVVPALWGAGLRAAVGAEEAERLFGWVLLIFLVPLALVAVHRTRRAGAYMLAGMVLAATVVVGVAAAVLWVLMR